MLAIKLKSRKSKPTSHMDIILEQINLPYNRLIGIPYKISNTLRKQNLIIRDNVNSNYVKKIPYIILPEDNKSLSKHSLNKLYIKKLN